MGNPSCDSSGQPVKSRPMRRERKRNFSHPPNCPLIFEGDRDLVIGVLL